MPDVTSPPTLRVAVVGGGISGLAAAHRVLELADESARPVAVTLYEAGQRLGGMIATERIGEYLVELGADSFITNKPAAISLCRRLGLDDQLIGTDPTYRKSLVLRDGRPVEVPDGFTLLTPATMGPILRSPIFSWRGKLRMGWERFVPARRSNDDESLASFVRRRFGQEALERLVQPLVGGIYTSDPEKLSLRATMPRFLEMEREHGSLIKAMGRSSSAGNGDEKASGARYGLFVTLRDGLQTLFDQLLDVVTSRCDVKLQTRVGRLTQRPTGWQVGEDSGAIAGFDAVILALPAYRSGQLCREASPELAAALEQIEYASSAIVVSGHSLSDFQHPLDAFGLVVPEIERRKVLAVSFSSRKFPGRAPEGKVLLRTFVGGAMHPELLQHTDDELMSIVTEELTSMLGLRGNADFMRVVRYERAMPQYHVGHLDRVARIESLVKQIPGLALAGNAYRGVGIPDSVQSGETAAETVLSSTGATLADG